MNLIRMLIAASLAAGLLSAPARAHAAPEITTRTHAAAAPVYVVTSREAFAGVATLASDAQDWTDRLGRQLVVAQLDRAGIAALVRHVHEVEHRCGGFFAFGSRPEAEAFIASDRSHEAMHLPLGGLYTIDNPATVGPWLDSVSEGNLYDTIATLSAFHNRYYESTHGRDAALWIRDRWQALAHGRSDVQVDLFEGCTSCSTQPSVIMTVQGNAYADEVVVIGGHLDSIKGHGYEGAEQRAPGADDDASGIATITEIIRIALANGWKPQRTVQFMGYAAEEVGLLGSKAIAASHAAAGIDVVGVLQLDMTNYADGAPVDLRIVTDNSNPALVAWFGELFDEYLAPRGFTRGAMTCGYGCSDHAAWTQKGYPAGMVFEAGRPPSSPADMAAFPYIHTANDTLANMGHSTLNSVPFAQFGLAFLGELAKTHDPGSFNMPPVAAFTWQASGLSVQFTDASNDLGGTIVAHAWDFGDGSTSTLANPGKTFATAGTHLVTLTVTDDGGLTDTIAASIDLVDERIFGDGFEA